MSRIGSRLIGMKFPSVIACMSTILGCFNKGINGSMNSLLN